MNWCIWENNKNNLSSNTRAHPLEPLEEMSSEHSPRGFGKVFKEEIRRYSSFCSDKVPPGLIVCNTPAQEDKLSTSLSRAKP